ncbi:urea ABC transporter substrate-binding protein [Cyanobium sp. FACHB-13342]|uniref:urea ABC transporter substrate-binding protein n=1 Tax=Cyanobium sp. FACHB-13342 TaxID=2692793 RepID=UPI0016800860|nr:urea ABC transporter substrate-binding protein [Cyanobium sp. FACHB-13342]MBD2424118.1 urea ABC transporter substrate-binding protein [Cyanobium sp. FACHB-13342]
MNPSPLRNAGFRSVAAVAGLSLALAACGGGEQASGHFDGEVKVGILHSRSGTMSISENTVAEAELMAIDEINAKGGVRIAGKKLKIVPIEEDGASDWPTFAQKAEKLIDRDRVAVVFGGWTSASRKAMLPVFEAKDHFLFYPIQYEGQECSRNIFYSGAAPNQQAEPAVDWLLKNKGQAFFLVGSDYVYPRTANTIMKEQLKVKGGTVVGEEYLPLGNTAVAPIIAKIKQALPTGGVIVNTLNGDSNVQFFKQMQAAGITPAKGYSIMSFSIAEEEIAAIGPEYLQGTYAAWNYFQTLDTPASKRFTKNFKAMYGENRVTNDPSEAAYMMVYLWAAAAEKANSIDDNKVREALVGVSFEAPEGKVTVQPNHHVEKLVLIGEVREDGLFKILENKGFVKPVAWNQYVPETKGYTCDWTRTDVPDPGKFQARVKL